MPDISMCIGGDCPRKNDCYRYRAIPNSYQTYFVNPPFRDGDCKYFNKLLPGDRLVPIEEIGSEKHVNDRDI